MKISFGELRIGQQAIDNLNRVIKNHWASGGSLVQEFEEKWGKQFGYKHSIAVSSGTDAGTMMCALLYDFGAQRGDEIICPACCFVSVANSILAAGFIPKFVDISRKTLNIDPDKIEAAITPKTRAIKVVHTMGKPCDMDKIVKIAAKHNLYIIEDCCESHGASYKGKLVGTFGLAGSFSFYAAHLVVCGEGGMVVTNDDKAAAVLKSIKTHGRRDGMLYFDFVRFGLNCKMNDMEAAIGLEGLSNIDATFKKRKDNYYKLLAKLSNIPQIQLYYEEPYEVICPHAFPVVCNDRPMDFLYNYLEGIGIQCKTIFASLPTQHKAFEFLGYKLGDFPEAEYIGKHGLHFGVHQYLEEEHLDFISDTLHKFFEVFPRP